MNLVLVGCRGSGKSTVGHHVAQRFGWGFIDLDEQITAEAGISIREIFATEGEAGFRRREREACQSLRRMRQHVIALGGGALASPDSRQLIKRIGKIIWLRAPAAVLWSRISIDPQTAANRPNLTSQGGLSELEATVAEREPQFEAASHHIIDTVSTTIPQIVEAIELWYLATDGKSR